MFDLKFPIYIKEKISSFSYNIEGCNYIDMDVQGFEYQILVEAQGVLQQLLLINSMKK